MSTNVMPCCFFVPRGRTDQAEHPVRLPRVGRPDLAAGAHQIVAVVDRGHGQGGEVGPGLRLGIALAEEHLAGEDAREEVVLLSLGPVLDDRVRDHANSHGRQGRSTSKGGLATEDVVLGEAPVTPTVLEWPRRCRPASGVQDSLPFEARVVVTVDTGHQAAGASKFRCQLLVEEGAHLVAKGDVGRRPRPGPLSSPVVRCRSSRQ